MADRREPGGPYPPHWEADVVLSDGGTVHLRPIRTDDGPAIRALHARLSERTRYLRYFGPYPTIPDRDLVRLTHVDHHDRVALVAQLGPDIVAVGRYERIPGGGEDREAEVAFVVQDDQQGRGIGSVLLEHLAAAARERGVRRFVADVLAENSRMVRVFLDAGYQATREYDGGVVRLAFPIAPTETSTAVRHEREQRAEARSIERLLTPRSVAVVGASRRPGKVGHAVFTNLLRYGFQGPVYPVNPTARHVAGVRAYPSVLDIPDEVDLVVVAVPAPRVAGVVEQCARKRVRGLLVLSAGFGERGEDGRRAERDLVATARGAGMRVVGPHCLGLMNTAPDVALNATVAPLTPRMLGRGRVGFFCQSGALGGAILEEAARRGLGLTSFVSAGNRADVSGNDLLQYWESDPATEVVLLYLESFGNPRKFARLARRLARRTPVVAVKSALRAGPAPGLASYDVAVPEHSVDALFASCGLIRVQTVAQLFDVGQLLAYQPLPAGRRVAVVGNDPALGALAADACLGSGLRVACDGPVCIDADAPAERLGEALGAALRDPGVDLAFVFYAAALATSGADVAEVLSAVTAGCGKPVASTFLGTQGVPESLRVLGPHGGADRGSIPSYPSPEQAAFALSRVAGYAEWRRRPAGTIPDLPDVDAGAGRAVVAAALEHAPAGRDLDLPEASGLLAAYGIALWPSRLAWTGEEAVAAAGELGYPVVLKSTARWLRHRGDLGGTRLDLASAAQVRAAHAALARLDAGPVIVQPVAPPGVATVVAANDDPSFGALVSFGVGGVTSALLGDRSYAAVPLSDHDARTLVRSVRAAPLLSGYHGSQPVDLAAVEELVLRVSRLVDDLPEVLGLELNPVLADADGLAVLSARVHVGPATARVDPGPRRLR